MIKVGIIGLGKMGKLHLMNSRLLDNVNIVAAADFSRGTLNKARSLGVENIYEDYHEMLKSSHELDAVIITLPNYLHFEAVELALEAGLNVFVEKPIATTVKDTRKIVKLVGSSGRKLMIGHAMRFFDAIEKMKTTAEAGRIGDLEVLTIEEVYNGPFAHPVVPKPVPEWWFDRKKAGGGVLLDLGYHLIDLYRFFAGDCRLLFASLDHKFNLPIEDGAIIILGSPNSDTKGIVNTGWYQKIIFPKYNLRVILHGNAGYLSSEELTPKNFYLHAVKEGTGNLLRRVAGRKIRPLSYTYFYEAYYKELKHFYECVEHDLEPSVPAIDGLKVLEIIEEAYKSEGKYHQKEDTKTMEIS